MTSRKKFVSGLTAVSNAKRLEIMEYLSSVELSVNVLAMKVGLSQSALSQHLSKLRANHLVSTRREGQTVYYTVASPAVITALEALERAIIESAPKPKAVERTPAQTRDPD